MMLLLEPSARRASEILHRLKPLRLCAFAAKKGQQEQRSSIFVIFVLKNRVVASF